MTLSLPDAGNHDFRTPLGNFAFHVSFEQKTGSVVPAELFGAFSEISGLEATMEHKVIKEGGNNYGPAVRIGPVSFATVILKRGIIEIDNLWNWWSLFTGADGQSNPFPGTEEAPNRCDVLISLVGVKDAAVGDPPPSGPEIRLVWRLRNAMPVKFRAGDLNAKGNDIAVEELHLVHEGLAIERPGP